MLFTGKQTHNPSAMPRLKVCFLLPVWIFLVGCSGAPDSHHPVRLLALKGPSAMGLVHLMDSLDQSHDTTLQIRIFDEPNQVRTIILQNGCELAYVPMNMAAILCGAIDPFWLYSSAQSQKYFPLAHVVLIPWLYRFQQ